MNKQRTLLTRMAHVLLIIFIVAPQLAWPRESLASAPLSASLVQGRNEDLDTYLQRVAETNPSLFQQAAVAAVQDAFNGEIPAALGEDAMEEQIAYYLHLAATGGQIESAPAEGGSSSAIQGDAYLWNATETDETADADSTWQLTARPGVDTTAFAGSFEQMLAEDRWSTGLPETAVPAPSQSAIHTSPRVPAAPDAAAAAPLIESAGVVAEQSRVEPDLTAVPLVPGRDVAVEPRHAAPGSTSAPETETTSERNNGFVARLGQAVSGLVAHGMSPAPARPVQLVAAPARQADLAVSISAPVTATYGEIIIYSLTITNNGPSLASNVRLTQTLPANGVLKRASRICRAADSETVTCAVGRLRASQSRRLSVRVEMQGNDVVTSTATVKDAGRTLDPGGEPAEAEAATTIESPSRSERELGNVVIAANEFITVAGEVEASGAVEIGYTKADDTFDYHLRLGPDDSLSWKDGEETATGEGTLVQIVDDFELFEGSFNVDGSQKKPKVVPDAESTPLVRSLAGFEIVGEPRITEVFVYSGTATVSTRIKMGQPGVLTETTHSLVGIIKPGGKAEGTIPKFETTIAGLTVKVSNATFSDDRIIIKQARVTMPESLGRVTGIISQMEFTADSISFGGVGATVPIPDIYPVGRPVTGTNPYTPTFAFVDNSATLMLDKGLYSVQVESILELSLPGNHERIPAEIKIDAAGKLVGTIKEIDLTIAGQQLTMREVQVSNSSLSVKEATLAIRRGGEQPKPDVSARAQLAIARAEPEPQAVLTVVVKKVTVDRRGLSIGEVGVTNPLPDFKIGEAATFSDMTFTLTVKNPTGDASFEFEVGGTLKIHLSNNEQEIEFTAKIDKDGEFSGTIERLSLTIAKSTLEMEEIEFSAESFTAESATLTLPEYLGSVEATINQVVIDEEGLSFGDASVEIPVRFTIGKEGDQPNPTNSFQVDGSLSLILAQDRTYGFAFEGTVTIKLAAQTVEAGGSFRMDDTGAIRGSIDSFQLTIAGMTLGVRSASVEDGVLKAQEATLAIPEEWGGLSATVYELEISDEELSIGGGSFTLPEIKVGDMRLSLEGTLKKENGGWIIAAGGSLKLPNTGAGCSGLGVSVEIFAGSGQAVVMELAPAEANATSAFQLRQASVTLRCDVVLGTSGFVLTGISGTVTLNENVTKLDVKATIESQLRVGPYRAVTADGNMYMEYVKDPYKFEIGIGASMRIFSMFEAARASATMTFASGEVPFMFKAELNINAVIARGDVKLTAWTSNGDFHLVGRIFGSIGVRRGGLVDRCFTILVPRWGWPPYREAQVCATIPESDLFINATMEFGEFKYGDGSTWGLKASVNILGANYGVYVDTEGNFKVGNVDDYRTIDPPSLAQARALNALAQTGQLGSLALTAADRDLLQSYHFAEDGAVTIDVADLSKPGDLMVTAFLADTDADLDLTLVRPDGLRIASSNLPGNVTMRRGLVDAQDVRDPETGAPVDDVRPMIEVNITVTNAELGQWQIVMDRDPASGFVIHTSATVYGVPVEKLAVAGQNDTDNQVALTWQQTTELTSTAVIYATQDTITSTASYTDTRTVTGASGITASEVVTVDVGVVTQFGGQPVAEFAHAAGDQTITERVDLSELKTGSYSLWLEVNDGQNPPSRQYFPGKVAVWHPWQDEWTAGVRVTPELGALTVAWDGHPNPDVDGYDIEIYSEPSADFPYPELYVVDAGDVRSETISGLSALREYAVTVQAYNIRTDLVSVSESVPGRTLRAPFSFSADRRALRVEGGSSVTATLTVTSLIPPAPHQIFLSLVSQNPATAPAQGSSATPMQAGAGEHTLHPNPVFLDFLDAPDGLQVALSSYVVTPTVGGTPVGLVVTPTTSLPSGVYTVTVRAASDGDVHLVSLPVTVQAPLFTPRASSDHLMLLPQGSVAVDIGATYEFGEQDTIDVEVVEIPPGVEWAFTNQSFRQGEKATLVLTDTGYLPFGDYEVILEATDYQQAYEIVLPLTVTGFSLTTDWDSVAVRYDEAAAFLVALDGHQWTEPLDLGFDPESVGDRFITTISGDSTGLPATFDVEVAPLPETTPGIYTLLLEASSAGISQTLPLYVTVQDDPLATDLLMGYELPADSFVVAGAVFSYTLAPHNISANPAEDVIVVDTMAADGDFVTVVSSDGCSVQDSGSETTLTCALGTIAPDSTNRDTTVSWLVAPDAPEGTVLTQVGQAIVRDTSTHTETSTLDNLFGTEHVVVRDSDLRLQTESTPPVAGDLMTVTATVSNQGPSHAGDTLVDFFLPTGVSLEAASSGCVQEDQFVQCPVGLLPSGASGQIVAIVRLEPDYRGFLELLVEASSASYELNFDDNYDDVLADVTASARLSMTLTPDRTEAVEGDTVNYLIAVTNQGPATATDVGLDLPTPETAGVVDIRVGGAPVPFSQVEIAAGATVTATASVNFLENDQGEPQSIRASVAGREARPVSATSPGIRIANAAPTAILSGTLTLDEGEVGIITAHTDDPGSDYDPFELAWDLDGDGEFDDSDQPSVRFNTRGMDGPFTQPIAVRVTDDDGGEVVTTATVTVNNVVPMVTTGHNQYKRYDLPFEVPFQAFDAFPEDIRTARIDWGDGTVEDVPLQTGGEDEQASHTYNRIGTFTANVCVNDDDGGQGCAQVVLQAACRDNGLLARFTNRGNTIAVRLENASGTVAIPVGMPFTLYNGDQVVHTFRLDTALAVGASRTLEYDWTNGDANASLRLVVDDDGAGTKTTDLCAGTVSETVRAPAPPTFLPLVSK